MLTVFNALCKKQMKCNSKHMFYVVLVAFIVEILQFITFDDRKHMTNNKKCINITQKTKIFYEKRKITRKDVKNNKICGNYDIYN